MHLEMASDSKMYIKMLKLFYFITIMCFEKFMQVAWTLQICHSNRLYVFTHSFIFLGNRVGF
jgi:hypothetical protein